MSSFVILNKPHYSTKIKRDLILLSNEELEEELFYSTDWFTDELFELPNSMSIGAEWSRIMVDCEKINNENESGNALGRGVLYSHSYKGELMRIIDSKSDKFLDIYNERLDFFNNQLSIAESYFDEVIVIDCHSFDEHYTNTINKTQGIVHPDICVGFNEQNCVETKVQELKTKFESLGYSVGLNYPFSGSYLPEQFIGNPNVSTVMVEVNKKLYMNHKEKSDSFDKVKKDITECLSIFS